MKKVFAIVLCLALVLSLGACTKKDDKVIKVGATPAPHAEILREVAKVLEKDGWTLEIKEFNDYVQPNNAVEDGDKSAIPNDTTNRARALLLLQDNGIITLKDGVGLDATAQDIVSKKVDVDVLEMEAAQLPQVLDSVALAVINGNYALGAGLNVSKDAIAYEGADSLAAQTYGNVLVVKDGNEKTAKSEALKKALLSDTVRDFINSNYDGAVVPMF